MEAWRVWGKLRQGFRDYLDDVRSAIQEDQGVDLVDDNREPDRMVTIRFRRPWGRRHTIIKAVAGETGLSERLVRECWQKFLSGLRTAGCRPTFDFRLQSQGPKRRLLYPACPNSREHATMQDSQAYLPAVFVCAFIFK